MQLEEKQEKERNEELHTNTFQKVAQEEKTTRRWLSSIKKYLEAQWKILKMPVLPWIIRQVTLEVKSGVCGSARNASSTGGDKYCD